MTEREKPEPTRRVPNENAVTLENSMAPEIWIDAKPEELVYVTSYQPGWLTITTLEELFAHEQQIVARIAYTHNGGMLFLTHPLQLLADIGVELSEHVKAELVHHEPSLAAHSLVTYSALKASLEQQYVRVRLHGLFERRTL
jgi:hypothetical protein